MGHQIPSRAVNHVLRWFSVWCCPSWTLWATCISGTWQSVVCPRCMARLNLCADGKRQGLVLERGTGMLGTGKYCISQDRKDSGYWNCMLHHWLNEIETRTPSRYWIFDYPVLDCFTILRIPRCWLLVSFCLHLSTFLCEFGHWAILGLIKATKKLFAERCLKYLRSAYSRSNVFIGFHLISFHPYFALHFLGGLRIYVLICVGLAVDYAAHIAHMFKDAVAPHHCKVDLNNLM